MAPSEPLISTFAPCATSYLLDLGYPVEKLR